MVSAFMRLRNEHPELNLIIAPRHPERFQKVEEMLRAQGLPYIKRSKMSPRSADRGQEGGENQPLSGMIVILDSIGELAPAYGMAEVAVIGGASRATEGTIPSNLRSGEGRWYAAPYGEFPLYSGFLY